MAAEAPLGVEVLDHVWDRSAELIDHLSSLDSWERSKVQRESNPIVDSGTSSTIGLPLLSLNNPSIGHDFARTVWQKMSNYALVYGVPVYDLEPIVFNRYEPENQTKYSAAF